MNVRCHALRFAAILHDIGKLHIPDRILLKNKPLTESEWAEIKRHTLTGVEMIRGIPLLSEAIPIIRHHHERWDGDGYPDGLAGVAIPPGARMLGVVDSFDTMVSPRVYARQLNPSAALDELNSLAGMRYDPSYCPGAARGLASRAIYRKFIRKNLERSSFACAFSICSVLISTTAPTMIMAARIIRGVTGSSAIRLPNRIATNGFT